MTARLIWIAELEDKMNRLAEDIPGVLDAVLHPGPRRLPAYLTPEERAKKYVLSSEKFYPEKSGENQPICKVE